ncbi:TolC family protein [Leptospira sp. GIMC2001]|uniref:TolC family protein n=1 Tax=Leptospira sp. GIMC2001 TaxID=1513297 RepID=UPI002349F1D4|nr:TolC family protein [Leptospira sp. GIMC2001]WCL49600.1 TolC family protein [Leptospira sp. GIMC2001]
MKKVYLGVITLFAFWDLYPETKSLKVDPMLFQKESANVLSLEKILQGVERSYPLILAAERLLTVAEYEYLAAQGAFDLSFESIGSVSPTGYYQNATSDNVFRKPTPLAGTSFFGGYRLGRGNFPAYYGNRATNELGEFRAGAIVPLMRNREIDKNRAELKKADVDRTLAELSIQKLKLEVIRESTKRYWKWVASGQEYKVNENLLKIAQERVSQVSDRVKLGDLPAIENTENDRAILQRESLLISSRRELQKAAIDLSLFLREPNGKMILPTEDQLPANFPRHVNLDEIPSDNLIKDAWKKRPEIQEYQAKREKVAIDRQFEQNNLKPQVDLVVSASQDIGAGSPTRSRPELEATLVMNFPLQTRRQRGKIGAAEAKIAQIDQEEKFARDKITTEVQDALSEVSASYERVEVAKKELVLAKKLQGLEQDRFALGDSTLLFVNIREQTAAEAAIREVKALNDFFNALANYHAAIADNSIRR